MIRNNIYSIFMFMLLVFLLPTDSFARISLSTVIVDFEPGKPPYRDVFVNNESDEKAYVQIEIAELRDPGTPEQTRHVITSKSFKDLIVSPRKLVIPPRGRKRIRYISQHKDIDKDKIYRVKVEPMVGNIKAENIVVKIVIAYDTLVIVRPSVLKPDFSIKRKGKEITVTNTGNTSVLLRKGEQCNADKSACEKTPGKRIHAGKIWVGQLPIDGPIDYTFSVGGKLMLQHVD